ncbi:MAG: DMT family transporter [Prolixibacteraceae bacterium]
MNLQNLSLHKPSKKNNEQKATIYALLTVLFWSSVATAFKIGLRAQAPEQLIFIASVTTVIVLFIILIISGKLKLLKQLSLKSIGLAAILGFLNPFVYYIILFKAYALLPAQVAQPINMIWPVVLVLMSVPLLKQKLEWKHVLALLISFFGVFLISSQGDFFSLGKSNPVGIALGLSSAIVWSLYWIFNVRSKEDIVIKLFISFVFGTIYLLIYLPLFSTLKLEINQSFYAGIYIGLFEIGFSFIFWMKALSLTSHNARVANLIYIVPFISLIFIHFILKEQIFITTIIGIILIISGILFQQTYKSR